MATTSKAGSKLAVEAEFAYREGMEPLVAPDSREGVMIGSGDGVVSSEGLTGTVRWTFFSGDCAYLDIKQGIDPGPGTHACTVSPVGVITTDDGAEVWFEGRGYGLRGADPSTPHLWRMEWFVRFETADARYAWLDEGFGHLEGTFDEQQGRAWYQGEIPTPSPSR